MLLDLLLPERCVVCLLPGETLCAVCFGALPRVRGPRCDRCGAPTAWPVRRCAECTGRRLAFARARGAVAYTNDVRALVTAWKQQGLRRLARVAADLVVEVVERPPADAIVCIPADVDRTLKRAQHPAAALARELAQRWELPICTALTRAYSVPPQRGLSRVERRRNVRRAFAAHEAPRRLMLVDDVYTTGATANAAASTLRAAGARRVEVVTFARAIRTRA